MVRRVRVGGGWEVGGGGGRGRLRRRRERDRKGDKGRQVEIERAG